MAGVELPDDVICLGGEPESIVSIRCRKVASRGTITLAGAGGNCGQIAAPGGGLLLAQPESSSMASQSGLQFELSIFQILFVGGRRGRIIYCRLVLARPGRLGGRCLLLGLAGARHRGVALGDHGPHFPAQRQQGDDHHQQQRLAPVFQQRQHQQGS
ncbi:hypothetical protein MY55_13775 [Chromobacterium subtsugae]|nr:hypothetical protein MY55_13775 [Chromobacterium subtsugae]